jgi:hypothetical protein
VADVERLSLEERGVRRHLLRSVDAFGQGVLVVALALDGDQFNWLAGARDAVRDGVGGDAVAADPHYYRAGDVRIAAEADQRTLDHVLVWFDVDAGAVVGQRDHDTADFAGDAVGEFIAALNRGNDRDVVARSRAAVRSGIAHEFHSTPPSVR